MTAECDENKHSKSETAAVSLGPSYEWGLYGPWDQQTDWCNFYSRATLQAFGTERTSLRMDAAETLRELIILELIVDVVKR